MLIHVNHAVQVKNFQKAIVASPDTNVLINLVYHLTCQIYAVWSNFALFLVREEARMQYEFMFLGERLHDNITGILPAIHALTG